MNGNVFLMTSRKITECFPKNIFVYKLWAPFAYPEDAFNFAEMYAFIILAEPLQVFNVEVLFTVRT